MLPDDVRTALLRAQKAVAAGEYEEALRLLDPISNRKAGAARTDELRGEAFAGLGQLDEAVQALQTAAKARPSSALFLRLADVLLRQDALEDARRAFRESLDGDPGPEVRFGARRGLAEVYRRRDRPDRAVRELRKALAVEGEALDGRDEVTLALAARLLELDRVDEAESALAPLAGEPAAAVAEGRILWRRGQGGAALEKFEVALTSAEEIPGLRLDAARAALDAGQPKRAAQLLDGVADSLHVRITRGRIALAQGEHDRARALLDRALDERPDDPDALSAAGWAALEMGDVPAALDRFHHLLTVTDSGANALLGLGASHAQTGELGTARRLMAAAVEQGAGGEARLRLGRILIELEDPAAAIECLSGAENDASDPKVQEVLADAYARLATPVVLPPSGSREPAAILRAARALRERTGASPHLEFLRPDAQRVLDALDAPLDVAILGEFNAGKSTLVNAFVGEVVVPTGVLPTTAHIDVLRFGPRRTAQLHLVNGDIEEVALRDVKKRVKADQGSIDHIEYLYPHPVLRRVHFWDTPGFNALDDDHERQANEALDRAEAIVWVLDATQALAETELTHLQRIHNAPERLVVVVNKVDRLADGELDEVVAHLQAALEHPGYLGIYPVSALECVRAWQADEDATSSGVPALIEALDTQVFDRAGAIKCVDGELSIRSIAQQIAAVADRRGRELEAAAARIDVIRGRIAAERDALATFVEEESSRLEGAFDLLVDVVLREVDETAQPGNRLLDTLFVRPRLDDEDLEFVLGFLQARYDDVLARSRARVQARLRKLDALVGQEVDAIAVGLTSANRRLLSRRTRDWQDRAAAQRRLLTERVHGRYVAIARGRASAPGAERSLRDAARTDGDDERRTILRRVLPEPSGIADAIVAESQEYFTMAGRFCDTLRADLLVMAIEARATATGLENTQ